MISEFEGGSIIGLYEARMGRTATKDFGCEINTINNNKTSYRGVITSFLRESQVTGLPYLSRSPDIVATVHARD